MTRPSDRVTMQRYRHLSRALLKLINTVLVVAPFAAAWFLYYEPFSKTVNSAKSSTILLFLYTIVYFILNTRLDGFRVSIARIQELAFSQITAVCATDVFAYLTIWMLSVQRPMLYPGLLCFALQILIITVFSVCAHHFFFYTNKPHKTAIVYDARRGMEELLSEYGLDKRYAVVASFAIEEVVDHPEKLDGMEDVFFCGVHTHERNILLKYCIEHHITTTILPRIGDALLSAAKPLHMFHLTFLRLKRYDPPMEYLITKRIFDAVASGIGLILLSPLMAILALLIRKDGGPAFYRQVRLTKDGREFEILKFRSMRVDAEKNTGAVLSTGDSDPRITRVGRVLRAYRLDELPQLINILKGDMSFVGPRPERPEIAAEIEKEFPEFRLRLQARAGLTGYAQVYGKYNTSQYDKTLMDLAYIAHSSLLEDLTIMLSTVRILFSKESTEGVGEEHSSLRYEPERKCYY